MEIDKLTLICGFSRSGTTWLGKILDSLPNTLLISEPDKRIYSYLKFGHVSHCCNIKKGDNPNQYKTCIQEVVDRIDCNLRSYPFFRKRYCNVPYSLYWSSSIAYQFFAYLRNKNNLYPLKLPRFLFKRKQKVDVLWKSVNQSSNLECLNLAFPEMKIIYIMRNPYASISSMLQHKKMALDGDDLRRINERRGSIFFKNNTIDNKVLKSLSDIQKRALLWRIDCESAYLESQRNSNIHIVLYEDLVKKTWDVIEKICSFLSFDFSEEIKVFLKQSTGAIPPPLSSRLLSSGYFGVYRNQNVDLNKWKKNLSKEDFIQVHSIIKNSPLINNWENS